MILSDANIISSFARINKIHLLRKTLTEQIIFVTPAVYLELKKAVELGCNFLEEAVNNIESKNGFDILPLSGEELITLSKLPTSLGLGEKETLSICLHHLDNIILTNDKRAKNFCKEKGLTWLDLPTILRLMWKRQICTKSEVLKIIQNMEQKEGIVFKHRSNILK